MTNLKTALIEDLQHLDTKQTLKLWEALLKMKVSHRRASTQHETHPLRGKPLVYHDPFEPTGHDDWEACH